MNDLIKKLKDKNYVRALGLMSPEEQKCFKEVGQDNCEVFCGCNLWNNSICHRFLEVSTYAINPDYKPEPEFVNLEIVIGGDWLGVHRADAEGKVVLPHGFTHLHCLPSLPNFVEFYYKYGITLSFIHVAPKIFDGKKVFARFRK